MIGWYLLVVAFAAYRLTRIVTDDTITLPWRDRLFTWTWTENDDGDFTPRAPWRTWAYALFTCGWCLGWWVSYATLAFWTWVVRDGGSVPAFLVAGAAVAGLQGLLASKTD